MDEPADKGGGTTGEPLEAHSQGPAGSCLSEDLILEYRSGQAPPELLAAIDAHLDGCVSCQELVELVVRDELDLNPHPSQLTLFHTGSLVASRYRIERFLGRGGMGEVYAATDELTRNRVALKTVLCTAADDPRAIRTLLGEVLNAQRVAHPHVFKIYDLHEHREPGQAPAPFFTMEYIVGEPLGARLRREGALPLAEVRCIARQLLAGLGAAHDKGVLHLDFKSDNVMLRQSAGEPDAVIMDFGLSRVTGNDARQRSSEHTRGGGTLAYMAVEQLECSKDIGAAADVYAFGVVLYEMLAGRLPFRGESLSAMLMQQLKARPPPPSSQLPGLSPEVDAFVLRCLRAEPGARFEHASLALAALDAIGDWAAPERSAGDRSVRLALPAPDEPTSSRSSGNLAGALDLRRPSERAGRASKAIAVGLAVLVVLVVLVGGLLSRSPRRGGERARQQEQVTLSLSGRDVPTPVTELPLPTSKSPEALAFYKAALQGIRDGNWGYVTSHLERAVELDPGMAIAQLRLAMVKRDRVLVSARGPYALAVAGRASLSERDQALLHAFEPVLSRDPPDTLEHAARLREATERFPGDAELFSLLCWALQDPEQILEASRRAVDLDPLYADAWQALGSSLSQLGRSEEALAALDRCVELSPASADCSGQRGFLHGSEGRCAEMDADFRRAVGISTNATWHDGRATALFARGARPEAIVEVFRSKWNELGEKERPATELLDRASLDVALGDFRTAERRLLEARDMIAPDAKSITRSWVSTRLMDLYTETKRPKLASRVAEEYLMRMEVWNRSPRSDLNAMSVHWAMLRAKRMRRDDFIEKRDRWVRDHAAQVSPVTLVSSYARGVETAEEAHEALALFPGVAPPHTIAETDYALPMFGKLYALAGRAEDALAPLQRSVQSCYALSAPFFLVRAAYHLGQALEATGDTPGACAAYARVLMRWGNARPPSVTATKARARTRDLRCELTAAPDRPG